MICRQTAPAYPAAHRAQERSNSLHWNAWNDQWAHRKGRHEGRKRKELPGVNSVRTPSRISIIIPTERKVTERNSQKARREPMAADCGFYTSQAQAAELPARCMQIKDPLAVPRPAIELVWINPNYLPDDIAQQSTKLPDWDLSASGTIKTKLTKAS